MQIASFDGWRSQFQSQLSMTRITSIYLSKIDFHWKIQVYVNKFLMLTIFQTFYSLKLCWIINNFLLFSIFSDHETGDDLPSISIIENLAEKLTTKQGLINVQAITSAKVPIIKFTNKMPKIESDISLYNILAQENTRMLRTYSR